MTEQIDPRHAGATSRKSLSLGVVLTLWLCVMTSLLTAPMAVMALIAGAYDYAAAYAVIIAGLAAWGMRSLRRAVRGRA
jgi:hypothetical protein